MNGYYIAAIILTAAVAFCAYKGATLQSKMDTTEQTARIEAQLQDLGNKILKAKQKSGDQLPESEIDELQKEYESIAKRFFEGLPVKVEEHKSRDAQRNISQLKTSRELEAHLRDIEQETHAMVAGFNQAGAGGQIAVQTIEFPTNVFQEPEKYRLLISFNTKIYWLVRFVTYPDRILALQLVRASGNENAKATDDFLLTNDSINLILLQDKFSLSLNQSISKEAVTNIVGDLPRQERPMSEFNELVKTIIQRAIEHELIMTSLKTS